MMNAKWMIAVASLAIPVAVAQTAAPAAPEKEKTAPAKSAPAKAAPQGEESKISQPANTATKGKAPAAPVKLTPEQQKMQDNTGTGKREAGTYHKKTAEEKMKDKEDAKKKRTGVTPEEQQKQLKQSPGN